MTQPRRRGRPRKTDRTTGTAIEDAAIARFATQGFEGTTLRQIAADARLDAAMISYRFGSKIDLWKGVIRQQSNALSAHLEAVERDVGKDTAPEAAAGRALRRAMAGLIDFLLERPVVPRFLLRDVSHDPMRTAWLQDNLTLPLHRHFVALAALAVSEGSVKRDFSDFRMANFIYAASSSVARRERLARVMPMLGDSATFRDALHATLIDPVFVDG